MSRPHCKVPPGSQPSKQDVPRDTASRFTRPHSVTSSRPAGQQPSPADCPAVWGPRAWLCSMRAPGCLEEASRVCREASTCASPANGASWPGPRPWPRKQVEGLQELPSPPVSTQASFSTVPQPAVLSLPPPGVCRPGLPRCLPLSPGKADLGSRDVPGNQEGST